MRAGAAAGDGGEHAAHDRERPSGGDDKPAGILGFGLSEEDPGVNSLAEKNQNKGAHEFAEPGCEHVVRLQMKSKIQVVRGTYKYTTVVAYGWHDWRDYCYGREASVK